MGESKNSCILAYGNRIQREVLSKLKDNAKEHMGGKWESTETGAGKMAQQEDQSQVLNIHARLFTVACNSSYKGYSVIFWPLETAALICTLYLLTHIHIK